MRLKQIQRGLESVEVGISAQEYLFVATGLFVISISDVAKPVVQVTEAMTQMSKHVYVASRLLMV